MYIIIIIYLLASTGNTHQPKCTPNTTRTFSCSTRYKALRSSLYTLRLSFEIYPYDAPQHERHNRTTQNQRCGGKN